MRATIRSAASSLGDDMRAGRALERRSRLLEVRDDRALSAVREEAQHRVDLRRHAAARKMTFGLVSLEIADADGAELALAGLAEVDRDARHRRQDHQRLDPEQVGH